MDTANKERVASRISRVITPRFFWGGDTVHQSSLRALPDQRPSRQHLLMSRVCSEGQKSKGIMITDPTEQTA